MESSISQIVIDPKSSPLPTAVITIKPEKNTAQEIVENLRKSFNRGRTRPLEFRREQLKNLLKFLKNAEEAIIEAEYKDLRKPSMETKCYEINLLKNEIDNVLSNLKNWAKPEKQSKPLANLFDGVKIYKDPYGVVLVLGTWNYPLHITLLPVVGAIAAGNCVVIKPSDVSTATTHLISKYLPLYLDEDCYKVFEGGIEETTELLKQRFDYIFYTGSTAVGKIVHAAANNFLTPVTLELGGKSPAYIDNSADLFKTVKRIIWGKCINGGQTCIAPDYILCSYETQQNFIKIAPGILKEFFGSDIQSSKDFCRIVNDNHFERVVKLLDGLNIAVGGNYDPKDKYIEPTIAIDVQPNHAVMQEEIFAPLLPIMPVANLNEAIKFINRRENPLAIYIFSKNKKVIKEIIERTASGGVTINDTIMHVAVETLPFGGRGYSGMGAYHGRKTFDTFVHQRSVLEKNFCPVNELLNSIRYPPYTNLKTRLITQAMKKRPLFSFYILKIIAVFLLGVIVSFILFLIFYTYEYKKVE